MQLFQNLIGNAIKFRGKTAGHFRAAEKTGQHWQFSLADNGIGIAPEFADNIFVVFQRLHARTEYPGNGIGLAICKKIIERYGGNIWVESQAGAEPLSSSPFPPTVPMQRNGQSMNSVPDLLIVDDNPADVGLACEALEASVAARSTAWRMAWKRSLF